MERFMIPVSPDGKFFIGSSANKDLIFPIEGGEPRPIPGLGEQDRVIRWSADARSLFVAQGSSPLKVFHLDLSTGRRELWKEITPTDAAGVMDIRLFPDTRREGIRLPDKPKSSRPLRGRGIELGGP